MAIVKPGVISNWELMASQVDFYRKHLDIFIEEQFKPIKLTRDQKIIARMIGNGDDIKVVCSRGFGKTWLTALCCHAICCLYSGCLVAVCSTTAAQGTLVLQKLKMLAEQNPNIAAELDQGGSRTLVRFSKDSSYAAYKNGSRIQSFAIDSMRGQRAKIVVVDEAPGIDRDKLDSIVNPIRNYRRDISMFHNFKDFNSKIIEITSACEKTNSFYKEFVRVTRSMAQGDKSCYSVAFNYEAAAANGITDLDFFLKEKARMPAALFAMEYDSIFIGASADTFFPYDLTQGCRTLKKIELEQPKNSKSRYIISLDIATSMASDADNAIFTVIKFNEKSDGSFSKKLVYISSFHGNGLDVLSNEMRKIYHLKFPNAERLIYDARGLGDSFSKFMDNDWIDPATGKEYPPLVDDDKLIISPTAVPVLHPIRAIQSLNQRMANNLRTMLEQRSIELPVSTRTFRDLNEEKDGSKKYTPEEYAIYLETDALQIEMGNIIQKVTVAGNYTYDTPRHTLHKDRYSSLAMACDYIGQLEEASLNLRKRGEVCVGLDPTFY